MHPPLVRIASTHQRRAEFLPAGIWVRFLARKQGECGTKRELLVSGNKGSRILEAIWFDGFVPSQTRQPDGSTENNISIPKCPIQESADVIDNPFCPITRGANGKDDTIRFPTWKILRFSADKSARTSDPA